MNEQTVQLLRDLAAKLGTTTEYLWSVLIKQAPIDAIMYLSLLVVLFAFNGWLFWSAYKYTILDEVALTSPLKKEWESVDGFFGGAFTIGAFIAAIISLIIAWNVVPLIISGFFNPEYWALQQILSKM